MEIIKNLASRIFSGIVASVIIFIVLAIGSWILTFISGGGHATSVDTYKVIAGFSIFCGVFLAFQAYDDVD